MIVVFIKSRSKICSR